MSREKVWAALIKYRWVFGACLEPVEQANLIMQVDEELKITGSAFKRTLLSFEDLPMLIEAFSFIHFCSPPRLTEAAKLGMFYEKLLEDRNAKSFVLATLNNMLQKNIKSVYNKDVVHQIFDELNKVYNFNLGPAILALASTSQLRNRHHHGHRNCHCYRQHLS